MNSKEFLHIISAILLLAIVSGFGFALSQDYGSMSKILLFSALIISVSVFSKKLIAYLLDADVEHKLWTMSRFGWKSNYKLKTEIPAGIIFPLFFSFFSLGLIKFLAFLTYETKALKHRAARRFGYYSYTEMTEWHNGVIGAAGLVAVLLLSFISYFPGFELLTKLAAFYAISNMLPISNLDGTQIFFGSRILYITMLIITAIFFLYAAILL